VSTIETNPAIRLCQRPESSASPQAYTEFQLRKAKRMLKAGKKEDAAALMEAVNRMPVPRKQRMRMERMKRDLEKKQD
jgi:hypothetical protein